MNCHEFAQIIEDFVSAEADEKRSAKLESHISSCENCATLFDEVTCEAEMYSHFLFDIEPPKDISAKFAAKLAIVEPTLRDEISGGSIGERISVFFGLFGLKQAFTAVALLIGVMSVFWFLNRPAKRNEIVAEIPKQSLPVATTPDVPVSSFTPPPERNLPLPAKASSIEPPRTTEKKQTEEKRDLRRPVQNQTPNISQKTSIDPQFAAFREFAAETDKQIEKVELLLRSFRNARYVEGRDEYDIQYEKGLARRLLDRNDVLRQQANKLGARFADEMLGRIEPYLVEISNLDNKPSDDEVLGIKQRVRNENIIAGLQGF